MSRFNNDKLAVIPSLEYFITHWKYGRDGDSSTILIDPGMRVIAFFDRGTKNIEVIQSDLEYRGKYVLECLSDNKGRVKIIKHSIPIPKYEPIYYKKEINRVNMKGLTHEDITEVKKNISNYVSEENKNYFKNLIKDGTQKVGKN